MQSACNKQTGEQNLGSGTNDSGLSLRSSSNVVSCDFPVHWSMARVLTPHTSIKETKNHINTRPFSHLWEDE